MRARLEAAADVLEHRGPNDGDWWLGSDCGLAHRRLAILDPSPRGRQPMVSKSGRFVIAYNGEIYNFRELAREFSIEAESGSDTEILLEAFERFGPAILPRLNGIFAFAIIDTKERVAWLARDRLGVKPLYLAEREGCLLFGSEIKAIFALAPKMDRELALASLHEWAWYGNALGGRTMFEGIEEIEPAGVVRHDLATGKTERSVFWSIVGQREKSPDLGELSDDDLAQKVAQALEKSVERQLVSDVPVGIFLSGGIDSSAITAFASRHYPDRLETFSVAFDYDRDGSELARARSVAETFGTRHHEIDVAVSENLDAIEHLVASHDLPFSDAANIPLMLLSERVSGTHKVILQGDGGDELFGGYSRYRTVPRLGRWKGVAMLARPFAALLPDTVRCGRARRYVEALGAADPAELVALLLTVERRSKPPTAIFGNEVQRLIADDNPFARYREVMARFAHLPLADRLFFTDMSIILPDIFLPKVDRSTMARGIEVRVPFLDNDLADLSIAIPAARKIPGGEPKGLLKRALAGIVPDDVLYGPKRGFGVPFGNWVAGPLAEGMDTAVAAANVRIPGLLATDYIARLREEHRAGRSDNGFILWKAFNLALWVDRFGVTMPGR
ncbi:asparagine synthase (glutamine-hydrolyzing) [Tsuneonella sp. YG55]|uniref:asparagine synthase (glutamine-hydrolyzing) n=1 Tax=Tsuneonella litorea TaxID=2976475 RepID=A0A9X3A8F9_9SPHN|nr:asparagine synthase (glutamine-hydrolyzing) [Tsuneonella litorea]MCT2557790.1 asparagine synthase (glutamine-hydrolyzing) [Tsuneonella litorea]